MAVATAVTTPSEQARLRRLIVNKRQATGLLIVAFVLFLATFALPDDQAWVGYVRAMLEASMIGGLADWFAVTALFRHPLGIPIPHTAIVPARKNQFGEVLGEFVQRSFLTPDIILERVRAARVADRMADWMAEPANAERLAGHAADAAVAVADILREDEVHQVLEDTIRARVDALEVAPLASRLLDLMTAGGRHHEVLDIALLAADRFVDENRATLRARFQREAPWWLPEAVEERIFERLLDGIRRALNDVATDPDHELRVDFDRRVRRFSEDLLTSPELRERGEQLKQELLTQPQLRRWSAALWTDIKAQLRSQAADPDSELRRRLAAAIQSMGTRMQTDDALRERVQEGIESGVRYVAEHFHDEIAGMVSTTISRWDAQETSRRLELLLGPDLQFIRINGTVVGGLAGLAIHAASQFL
jgi:uncharacterized membrane-anchored protein YjiN (DUF445 family)